AAEFSLVRVRRTRIEQLVEEGNRGARRVERLTSQPGRFLATIQIGLTFVGFLAATFAGASIVGDLTSIVAGIPVLEPQAELISLLLVTSAVSFFTILFGELVPKAVAYAHAERLAFIFAAPIDFLGRVLAPLVWLLTSLTQVIARAFGVPDKQQEKVTAEELMILVERSSEQGVIEAEEQQMIGAVLELGEQHVHEVMVPRIDIQALPVTATLDEMISTIVKEGHSRIPIYEETVDKIIGILYAKDLLPLLKGGRQPDLRKIVRPPVFVPESISIDDLLHQLQRQKVHIAIVLDEYGGTAGLVTIEDILEEIVGEIIDESDRAETTVTELGADSWRVTARLAVDELEELTGAALERDDVETVGGLLQAALGRVPIPGAAVEIEDGTVSVRLEAEKATGRRNRIGTVLVTRREAT
ncbi:MAG: hemolysin family protein, partial [Mycobacteriales bacterium]